MTSKGVPLDWGPQSFKLPLVAHLQKVYLSPGAGPQGPSPSGGVVPDARGPGLGATRPSKASAGVGLSRNVAGRRCRHLGTAAHPAVACLWLTV